MAKAPRPWIVTPHSPIEKIEDNLWSVQSPVPTIPNFPRRMTIVKLSDGRLLFHDSIPVDDATLAEIKAWGKPAIQVITHNQHCIDAAAFKEKLGLKTYCPRACETAVRARVSIDGTFEDLPADPAYEVRQSDGLKNGESWFIVKSGDHKSLITADTVMFVQKGPFMTRLMGFIGPEPKVAPPIFRLVALKDKKAFRASFEKLLADVPNLTRVVPCHGAIIEGNVAAAIRRAMDRTL